MIKMTVGNWTLSAQESSEGFFPYGYKEHALLFDEYKLDDPETGFYGLAVHNENAKNWWPQLVVVQQYAPCSEQGFSPGCLLLPEADRLFIGAGERLLCYNLKTFKLLWEGHTHVGFNGWSKAKEFVVMCAELEVVVYDREGQRLWDAFVEPPWGFVIIGDTIELDIMGRKEVRDLKTGALV